jgi:hypothetical protein
MTGKHRQKYTTLIRMPTLIKYNKKEKVKTKSN